MDIDLLTLNIDPTKIEETIRNLGPQALNLKALLPVHVFGQPCEMDRIMEIAEKYNLKVIEDACEALGAEYRSKLKAQSSRQEAKGGRPQSSNLQGRYFWGLWGFCLLSQ